MEDIDNIGRSNNVKEDEGNINDHKTHRKPPATSSIGATCIRRFNLCLRQQKNKTIVQNNNLGLVFERRMMFLFKNLG
jgi:hypothetical protein